jgi:hypothetical protein
MLASSLGRRKQRSLGEGDGGCSPSQAGNCALLCSGTMAVAGLGANVSSCDIEIPIRLAAHKKPEFTVQCKHWVLSEFAVILLHVVWLLVAEAKQLGSKTIRQCKWHGI